MNAQKCHLTYFGLLPVKIFKRLTTLRWWICFLCFTFSFLKLKTTKYIRILQIKTSQFPKFSKNCLSLSLSCSFMWPNQLNLHLQSGPTFTASTCLLFPLLLVYDKPLFLLIWEAFWLLMFLFLPLLTVTSFPGVEYSSAILVAVCILFSGTSNCCGGIVSFATEAC